MKTNDIFFKRDILIASNHKKEEAIRPILEEKFLASIIVPHGFDTDKFGTFSGEIERVDSPLETARRKCKAASEAYGINLVIASEGSFGPHPTMFYIPANDEILLLADYDNDVEIAVRELSTNTNFSGKEANSNEEVMEFARTIGFPSHKVILRKSREDSSHIIKNINDWMELSSVTDILLNKYGKLFIETDMRAMNNPTRMSVIAKAANKLADLMASKCPDCQIPGFAVGEVVQGLPCSLCNAPTKSTLKHIYICKKCNYKKEVVNPNNKLYEEPMYCDWCNP